MKGKKERERPRYYRADREVTARQGTQKKRSIKGKENLGKQEGECLS